MKNKLEPNMYVRTKDGIIGKINYFINNNYTQKFTYIDNKGVSNILENDEILKASHSIIDLIEKNDFVNGHRVIQVDIESLELDIENSMYGCGCETIDGNKDIKSIVTKEQFESMKYEVK